MNKPLATIVVMAGLLGSVTLCRAEYPKPSIYPISWELKFEHGTPKRIAVAVPGSSVPKAYWYMTYTVTNDTDEERAFLPVFEILTEDGRVIRSDKNIPIKVFETIKLREGNKLLMNFPRVEGDLRIGPDQARDGVAIWEEPTPRMGTFTIFVQGLSGESVTVPGPDKKALILRKTLELDYQIRGDEVYPAKNEVATKPESWIMR
jgi:hypothetical protein